MSGAATKGHADNPPMEMPGRSHPTQYPVHATQRPERLKDLLTHMEVMYDDWENHVGNKRLYYVDGIISFMRMFPERRITFLKADGYIANAVKVVLTETKWTEQANLKWSEEVADNQLRHIRDKEPVAFTKAVHTIVACELALAKSGVAPQHWVYTYMRLVPAVYNIDRFKEEHIPKLLGRPNAQINLQSILGLDYRDVLKDLAKGHCVTAPTAHALEAYMRKDSDLDIGAVRCNPGKKRLGRRDASFAEQVSLR